MGDEDYGRYTLIWSYVVIFSLVADAGLGVYAIREIAKREPNSQYIVPNIILLRLGLALVCIGLIVSLTWSLNYSSDFLWQTFLASLVLLLYAFQEPLDAVLQANERFDLSATAVTLSLFVFVGLGLIALLTDWHITGVIIARLMSVMLSACLIGVFLRNYRAYLKWHITPALWPKFFRAAIPFGLMKVWVTWSLRIDLIIIAWFWTEQAVGWYGAAYAIILGLLVITSSINTALYPSMSRQFVQDRQGMPKIYALGIKYLLIISLPIAAALSLTSSEIILLVFGEEFAPAAVILAITSWVLPLIALSEFFRYTFLVVDREKDVVITLLWSALAGILLNLLFVPFYGLYAAATIAVVTELLLLCLCLRKLKFELKSVKLSRIFLKPLLVTFGLVIVLTLMADHPLLWQILGGTSAYGLLILLTGTISSDEYKQLTQLFSSKKLSRVKQKMRESPKTSPLVSVFIPVYNAEPYIAQTVESVLAQSYTNFELIIIDDKSTDNTANIIKKYENNERVQVIYNAKNLGMTKNWNVGLSHCTGTFIAKLDADDFYEPDYLQTVIEFFQQHKDTGLVFSGLNLIYPDGRVEPELQFFRPWVRNREKFLLTLLKSCIIRSPTVCVRRECYEQLGNFIEEFKIHSDWEMWVRIVANYPVGYIPKRLANYRMSHGGNCTAQSLEKKWSIYDLQLWLQKLRDNQLPYQLNANEQFSFYWGIYNLQMRFAAIAGYHKMPHLQDEYIAFAEDVLSILSSKEYIVRMRNAYINLHQGLHAFRENELKTAWYFFSQALVPKYTTRIGLEIVLTLKIIWRLVLGLTHHLVIKYYPGL